MDDYSSASTAALGSCANQLAQSRDTNAGDSHPEEVEDLAWLLEISAELRGAVNPGVSMSLLLSASVERLNASFGALTIPSRQLTLTFASRVIQDSDGSAMAIPIASRDDEQIGMLTFCKPVALGDFSRREVFVGQHIARLLETLLDSEHDPATGLLTRAAMEREAATIIAAHGPDDPHTLIHVDIDHLHVINETFGFECGDQAIAFIAQLLRPPHFPSNASCGRVAGDRFVVFLPKLDEGRALHLTQSFLRKVNRLTVGLHPQRIMLSVSCGVAAVPRTNSAFAKAMAAAELACRAAKEQGRNRSEVYLDVDDSVMRRKGDILSVMRLRAALDKDRLQMFAQRIAPLRELERTSSLECLVRLVAEDGAIIPPAEFLSAAARYQLLRAVDEWMLAHTFEALQPYTSMLFHGEISVALNISEQSLRDEDFLRFVEDRVGSSDLAPRLITFEISESTAARDLARTTVVIKRLRKLGCSLVLDDFGARVASLAHLRMLKPDRVKIDGGIVRNVLASAESEKHIEVIVGAAAILRIDCIAKHVESDALARRLRELGVGYVQGNCVHQAEPFAKLLQALLDEEQRQLDRLYRQPSPHS